MMRPMFGAFGKAASSHSIAFVSKAWNFLSIFQINIAKHVVLWKMLYYVYFFEFYNHMRSCVLFLQYDH